MDELTNTELLRTAIDALVELIARGNDQIALENAKRELDWIHPTELNRRG